LTVLGTGLLIAWAFGRQPVATAEVGAIAPGFNVPLLEGGDFDLTDHVENDGRPVVLNLWASWCIPCRTEMPALSEFARANPEVLVLGVAVEDSQAEASAFADEIGVRYPLAMGNAAFEASYPRLGLPVTYFIGPDGVVTGLHNGLIDAETLEAEAGG
jgi:cytochrome c biogenesis protein CcmG/thiol:disulfide interchange protein DsbE